MSTKPKLRTKRARQIYPYQINCTACDSRLVAIDRDLLVILGRRPIELIANPAGDTHIACHHCGNMVLLDSDLLLLR